MQNRNKTCPELTKLRSHRKISWEHALEPSLQSWAPAEIFVGGGASPKKGLHHEKKKLYQIHYNNNNNIFIHTCYNCIEQYIPINNNILRIIKHVMLNI